MDKKITRADVRRAVAMAFVSGNHERASTLVLMSQDNKNLGGWGQSELAEFICSRLGLHQPDQKARP